VWEGNVSQKIFQRKQKCLADQRREETPMPWRLCRLTHNLRSWQLSLHPPCSRACPSPKVYPWQPPFIRCLSLLSPSTNSLRCDGTASRKGGQSCPKGASLELEFERAEAEKNLIRTVELCQELKERGTWTQAELKVAYGHLIKMLGHYGLWTQVYGTVNELMEVIGLADVDDQLWATMVDAFVECNRSTDVLLSLLRASPHGNLPGPATLAALFRAAILHSNLAQSFSLLQTASDARLLSSIPKLTLIHLATSFAQHAQLVLAIDLIHSLVVPINQHDHPDCVGALISLLRACVNRSDPRSTLYCYSYLATKHGEKMEEMVEEGLLMELLALSSRHTQGDLGLKVLRQLVRRKRKLETRQLFPVIIALAREGGRMREVMEMLVRAGPDVAPIGPEEADLLAFHLLVGHLGGLQAYRNLLLHRPSEAQQEPSEEEEAQTSKRARAMETLEDSKQVCRHLWGFDSPSPANTLSHTLVRSLIQADLELGRPLEALATFKAFLLPLPSLDSRITHCIRSVCLTNIAQHLSSLDHLNPDYAVAHHQIRTFFHLLQHPPSRPV